MKLRSEVVDRDLDTWTPCEVDSGVQSDGYSCGVIVIMVR